MAVEDVNKAGGINGSPLEIIFEDDQLNPQQSVTLFRKLVNDDNVVAVIGPQSGGGFEAIAPLANQFEVPAINVNALKPGISQLPWAMRFHSPDNYMIPEGVKKFKEHYPDVKKVVIIGDIKEASGAAGMAEFEKAAKAEGIEVLDKVGYQTGATDFSAAITKVKSYNPDAVFVSSLLAESLGAAKEMERQGFDIPILVNALTWVGVFPISSETAGKNWHAIGFSTNEVDPAAQPEMAEFNKRFIEKSLSNSQILQPANVANNALAYDAVQIIADILRKENINGDTPIKEARQILRDNLVQIKDHQGLYKFSMTESGDGYIEAKVLKLDLDKKLWVDME
jgi:ABC-type branched-subunit amino acid transport system substrate-binding protein